MSIANRLAYADGASSARAYHLPFAFTFPLCYTDCNRSPSEGACQLPPSLNINSPGIRVKVRYLIIAVVERAGPLCWNARVKQTVPFSPLLPECTPLESHIGRLPINSLTDHSGGREIHTTHLGITAYVTEPLPRYCPNLRLELLLPDPPILNVGSPIRVRLLFYVPAELLSGREVYIRSAIAHLRSKMTARLGAVTRSTVQSRHVWSARGMIPVDKEDFELDMGSWGGCVVLHAQPTFRSCGLDLEYWLEVAAGISLGSSEEVRVSPAIFPSLE